MTLYNRVWVNEMYMQTLMNLLGVFNISFHLKDKTSFNN